MTSPAIASEDGEILITALMQGMACLTEKEDS